MRVKHPASFGTIGHALIALAACCADIAIAASSFDYDLNGNIARVTAPVAAKPTITAQPADWFGTVGSTAVFVVRTATDSSNSFQWKKNGVNLAGATLEALALPNAAGADEGFYSVEITNPKGTVHSRTARLALDSDGDGMADWQEKVAFGSLSQVGSGDFDGDGITNAEELADGTNPRDRNSRFYRLAILTTNGSVQASPESATGRYAPGTKVTIHALPSGGYSFVEWQGQAAGVIDTVAVTMNSDATVEAVFGSNLGVALDAPELIWQTGPDAAWTGQGVLGHGIEGDWGQSAALVDPGQSWCAAYVDGPATVAFKWQVPVGSAASLKMYVDNVVNRTANANGQWEQQTVSVTTGRHLVRWVWEKLAGAATTPDVSFLDAVAVSTSGSVSLAQAVDAGELPWATDRMNPWFGTDQVSHDTADSASVVLNGQYLTSWLETRVSGPGQLSFWYRNSGGNMNVLVDGVSVQTLYSGWSKATLAVTGAGPHIVRWNADTVGYYSYAITATFGLDEVIWLPGYVAPTLATTLTFSDAVDNTSLIFTAGGKKPWVTTTQNTYTGGDAVQAGAIGDKSDSWIETNVNGPTQVYFYWRVQCATGDKLQVLVDGVERSFITGLTNWAQSSVQIAQQGIHTVRWRYVKDDSGVAGLDTAWLDYIYAGYYNPGAPAAGTFAQPLADALNKSALKPRTGGTTGWTTDTTISHDGTDSARSGAIAHSQESWMEVAVNGAGKFSFWWKASSEAGFDYLSLSVDGVEQERISGEADWQQRTVKLGKGATHVLRWRYVKDASLSSGIDAGWVDEIVWAGEIPDSTATVSPVVLNVGPQAGNYTLYVNDTGAWTTSEDLEWASLSTAGATGNANVNVFVNAQTSGKTRSGVLTVAGWNIVLVQEGYRSPALVTTVSEVYLGVGVPFSQGAPTALGTVQKWLAKGLPPGMEINEFSGGIFGTPTKVGTFSASIVATNPGGKSKPVKIKFIVRGPTLDNYSGEYVALVPTGTTLTGGLGGVVNLKVSAGKSASGVLQLGTQKLSFKAVIQTSLAGNQLATATIPRKNSTPVTLAFEFDTSRWVGFFSGSVEADGETQTFSGWKNLWSAKANPATDQAGYFTSALDLSDAAQIGVVGIPQGTGNVRWTVSTAGVVSYLGKTADGMVIAGKTILWPDGQVPLFALLNKTAGSIRGLSYFDPNGSVTGELEWTKLPAPTARDYPAGFELVPLTVSGGKWVAPEKGLIIFELPDGLNNALLEFAEGGLETAAQFADLDQLFEITSKARAIFPTSAATNPAGAKLKLDVKKGTFSGSMTLTDGADSRPVDFEGVLLSGERAGAGFFPLPELPLGAPPASAIRSGKVLLSPNP